MTSSPSVTSVGLSSNDEGDNEIIPGVSTDLLVFTFQLKKTPENLLYETVDEGCATSHRHNWVPLTPNDAGRITQHDREGEGINEGNNEENGRI